MLVNVDALTYQNQLKSRLDKIIHRLAFILINFGILNAFTKTYEASIIVIVKCIGSRDVNIMYMSIPI